MKVAARRDLLRWLALTMATAVAWGNGSRALRAQATPAAPAPAGSDRKRFAQGALAMRRAAEAGGDQPYGADGTDAGSPRLGSC